VTFFSGTSTAENATIDNKFDVFFRGSSNAGAATISNSGSTIVLSGNPASVAGNTAFFDTASAANATIIGNDGGRISFFDNSTGGSARLVTMRVGHSTRSSTPVG